MKKVFQYFLYVCFSPTGRINRAWWWLYALLAAVLRFLVVSVLSQGDPFLAFFNFFVVDVAFIYPGIVVSVKRFHDTNRSGWHMLWVLIPFFGALYILIVCGFFKGTDGENKYGDPSYLISKFKTKETYNVCL